MRGVPGGRIGSGFNAAAFRASPGAQSLCRRGGAQGLRASPPTNLHPDTGLPSAGGEQCKGKGWEERSPHLVSVSLTPFQIPSHLPVPSPSAHPLSPHTDGPSTCTTLSFTDDRAQRLLLLSIAPYNDPPHPPIAPYNGPSHPPIVPHNGFAHSALCACALNAPAMRSAQASCTCAVQHGTTYLPSSEPLSSERFLLAARPTARPLIGPGGPVGGGKALRRRSEVRSV